MLEFIIKMTGMGPKVYIRDQFNIFDAIVGKKIIQFIIHLVTISVVDLILNYSLVKADSNGGASAISALRAFRLVRVFKLAKSWTQLQHLLKTITQSLRDISSFSVLLLLLIFMYTLVGLELFSNSVKFNYDESEVVPATDPSGISPRNNFDDFYHSFLVVI